MKLVAALVTMAVLSHATSYHECTGTDSNCNTISGIYSCDSGFISACDQPLTGNCEQPCAPTKQYHACSGIRTSTDIHCHSINGYPTCDSGFISSCDLPLIDHCEQPCDLPAECWPHVQGSNCHIRRFGGVSRPTCDSGFVSSCSLPLTAHCYQSCAEYAFVTGNAGMIPINLLSIAVVVTMVLLAVNVTLMCAQQCHKKQGKGKYRAVQFVASSEDEERAQLQMQV